jgi:uncharacterized lipoprotein YmbA
MKNPFQSGLVFGALALLGATFLASSCSLPQAQPDTTRYYVLSAPAAKPATAGTESSGASVALRPVQVPSYLRGKAMPVRVAGNEINYAQDSRWAETLESAITRLLRDALEGRGGVGHVVSTMGEPHDYEIVVNVLRCEGDRETGVARLDAIIEIYSTEPGGARRVRESYHAEIPGWDRQSYGQLAQKLSEAVDGLADRIATLVAGAK